MRASITDRLEPACPHAGLSSARKYPAPAWGQAGSRRFAVSTWAAIVIVVLLASSAAAVTEQALREVAALTTSGRTSGKPRSVMIWFVYDAGKVYVQSGKGGTTDWYRNLLKTPAVTLKIGDVETPGTAQPIDDRAETARVHELFKQKYLSARVMSWFGGGFGTGKVVRIDVPASP
jgi:deazaflavin-dependent oxidoreductase (nitroreductase family)